MNISPINALRRAARKLIRELGVLDLKQTAKSPQHCHALIEINNEPGITITKLGHLLLLPYSTILRIVNTFLDEGLITASPGLDKREKYLHLTQEGKVEIKKIDEFANEKILGALEFLTTQEQDYIIEALNKYAGALEKNRVLSEQIKIHSLPTSRTIRKQVIHLIEDIQKYEFQLPITPEINLCVLKAENEFYYNNSYNFWYATDVSGAIIGSIGLKKLNDHHAEIKKFFVHAQYRGKGVSQKLMQTLVKAAQKHHFDDLYLGTVGVLKAAQRFYDKSGFSRIAEKDLPENFEKCPLDTVFFRAEVSTVSSA